MQSLIQLLAAIGDEHAKTPVQVAINWVLTKGGSPIPGARKGPQVAENAGVEGWRLTPEEVAAP